MILFGRITSSNVQKVLLALEELGLAYERREAGGSFGVVDTPEYRAMNPNGLVPTLREGDLVLWELNAIVRYLAARHGAGRLWPEDPAARALSDRWMDWQATSLSPAMTPAFHGLVRTPPERRDPVAIEASRSQAAKRIAMLDAALEGKAFVAGGEPTIGDIALMPLVHRWFKLPLDREPTPNLQRWYEAMRSRPSFAPSVPDELS